MVWCNSVTLCAPSPTSPCNSRYMAASSDSVSLIPPCGNCQALCPIRFAQSTCPLRLQMTIPTLERKPSESITSISPCTSGNGYCFTTGLAGAMSHSLFISILCILFNMLFTRRRTNSGSSGQPTATASCYSAGSGEILLSSCGYGYNAASIYH